jgi:Tfp pilus assembly protein PilF
MIKYIILPILAIVISSCRNYHLKKADEYLSNSNCEMAMGHLEKVKTKEAELDLDIKRAETYEQCGMTDSAFSVYFRLFERGYKNDQKHLSYGEFLLRKGEFKAADRKSVV